MFSQFIDMVLHIDKYLQVIVNDYSTMTYVFLFLIVFLETGIVATPFLPGDSLLFVAGTLAATGSFNLEILFFVIFVAAVLGDTFNYQIGKHIGPRIFNKEDSLFFRKDYLSKAQDFYEKNGKKTIILARFIPVIRTFAPFVAGIGSMSYVTFLFYNVAGAFLWCFFFIFSGFLFGNISWVQNHFGLLVLAIIFISLFPLLREVFVYLREKKQN